MLEELQEEFGLTYLFIAHDLSMVKHISTHIGVMYLGQMVERGPADDVYMKPKHPYTHHLLVPFLRHFYQQFLYQIQRLLKLIRE
mgnify:CR=1 FL=1